MWLVDVYLFNKIYYIFFIGIENRDRYLENLLHECLLIFFVFIRKISLYMSMYDAGGVNFEMSLKSQLLIMTKVKLIIP